MKATILERNAQRETAQRTAQLETALKKLQTEITDRKQVEEALRQSEERARLMVEGVKDYAILMLDLKGRVTTWNAGTEHIKGYSAEGIIGKPFSIFYTREDAASGKPERDLEVAAKEGRMEDEGWRVRKDGSRFWANVIITAINDKDGHPIGYSKVTRDLTDRKRAEETLRQSEEQFRLISENVADLIAVLDLQGTRVYSSPSYKRMLGDPEALRQADFLDEIHPEDRDKIKGIFEETVRTGVGQRAEHRFLLRDGSVRFIESQGSIIPDRSGKPANVLVVSRDVTKRKELEQQLRQSQKMEAVGQLAGGVAHDFNNLLTVISGFGELALEALADDDPNRGNVQEVLGATGRAASLTRQLLAFSRQQTIQPRVLNLNEVVSGMEKMLRRLIGEDVELAVVLAPELGMVKADPGQVEQVIMNLAINARDAMPKGGKLTIETANVELGAAYSRKHPVAKAGAHAMLAVSDTGSGMDDETQRKIFEPFFTTKEKGKGTGLGLATVYGIVKQSDGNIWVYSEPGRGSSFKIYLPLVGEEAVTIKPSGAPPRAFKGTETILVVEDEEAVRRLVCAVLEANGYKLLIAARGEEALSLAEKHKGPVKLMVTDLVMPGMNGRELAERLAPQRPEMKVLYISGYTDDTVVRHQGLDPNTPFLQKPFQPGSLTQKVREVLDAV